jgi:7-carboxy-7-deazaguanine synthase
VIRIMDVKCPGSGESAHNNFENFAHLNKQDEVKFVIADRADYEFARDIVNRERLLDRVNAVLFSPVHGELDPKTLSEWVIADRLPVRVQLQMHKYIWSPTTRGV